MKIEGKEVGLKEKTLYNKSTGDEAGASGFGEMTKIKDRAVVEAKKLLDLLGGLGPSGHKLLAITLVIGLAGGYGVGIIPYSAMKNRSLARIAELEEAVSAQESVLAENDNQNQELQARIDDMEEKIVSQNEEISDCEETGLELEGRLAELKDRTADQDSTIMILWDS